MEAVAGDDSPHDDAGVARDSSAEVRRRRRPRGERQSGKQMLLLIVAAAGGWWADVHLEQLPPPHGEGGRYLLGAAIVAWHFSAQDTNPPSMCLVQVHVGDHRRWSWTKHMDFLGTRGVMKQ